MVTMNYSIELDCDEKKFIDTLTNYENLTDYLPRQLQRIQVVESNENYTIIEVTIFLRSIIKKEFTQRLKIENKSNNMLIMEVLDGIAKGTQTTISVLDREGKTICEVITNAKLTLKTAILIPIMKKEYEGILTKFLRNIFVKIK